MKLHEVDLCGQHLYLCLNGQALFDIYDKFGTKGFITDPLKDSGKKSFEAVCYYLFKLSEQGELYRRWQGQMHGPVLTEQFFRVNLAPHEVAAAKDAILAAIVLGFRREEKETGDLDLGLVELQKKKRDLRDARALAPAPDAVPASERPRGTAAHTWAGHGPADT